MKKLTLFLHTGRKFYHRGMNEVKESIKHQRSADQFINQYENTIKEGGHKNAFGRLVAMGIDIKGKNNGIGQQRNTADGGKQGFVRF